MPDLTRLLVARLWVARLGERDVLRWWATDGILGPDGAFVGPRVLPKTHRTARARIAFSVAQHTCDERHPDPEAYHLFRLDPATEDAADDLMVELLGDTEWWSPQIEKLEAVTDTVSPKSVLIDAGVVRSEDVESVRSVEMGPAGRSLLVPDDGDIDVIVRRLAAGFIRSSPSSLTVPFIRTLPL